MNTGGVTTGRGRVTARGGRSNGRGRGRGGRGRGDAREEKSDDEDDIIDEQIESFVVSRVVEGEDVEDSAIDTPMEHLSPEPYIAIPTEELGEERHTLMYEFESGESQSYQSLQRFRQMMPIDIVLSLSLQFFTVLKDCSNEQSEAQITMADLYLYHAFLTFRTLTSLDRIEHYWYSYEHGITWDSHVSPLFETLTLARFFHIRKYLRGYKRADDVPDKDKGWKVLRAVEAVQETFRETLIDPGEFLSADEGIARGSSSRNPIYTSLGKSKPLEGFRFFILYDYETKVVVNFFLDIKAMNTANCAYRPGKFTGAVIDTLCAGAPLPGTWHKVFTDNYYNSYELVAHMKVNRGILLCGTLQRKHTTPLVYFGTNQRPKPSIQFPKGSLKVAKTNDGNNIFVYSWMESVGVYFIDPIIGPGRVEEISRKSSDGIAVMYRVPAMIGMYNRYMHGVHVFDQIRKIFGYDLSNATKKYTVRVFEILFSMILTQAYNVYSFLWKGTEHNMSHTRFKASVVKGFILKAIETPVIVSTNFMEHKLVQFEPGSAGGVGNRRKQLNCRACSNKNGRGEKNERRTSYYCQQCQCGLHPECFDRFHSIRHCTNTPAKRRALIPSS